MSNKTRKHNKTSIEKELSDFAKIYREIYIKYAGYVPSTSISEVKFDILDSNINSQIQSSLSLNGINTLEDLLTNYSKMNKKNIGEEARKCIERFIRTYYPFSLEDKDFLGRALEQYKIKIEADLETIDYSIQRLLPLLDELYNSDSFSNSDVLQIFINMQNDKTGKRLHNFLNKTRENRASMNQIDILIDNCDHLCEILKDNLDFSINCYKTYLNETYPDFGEV